MTIVEERRIGEPIATDGPSLADPEPGASSEVPSAGAPGTPSLRLALCIAFPVLAAAIMVGGIFSGASPRIYAALGGLLGIGLAGAAARLRRPLLSNAVVIVGTFGIGVLLTLPSGPDNVLHVRAVVASAVSSGEVLRPPVPFDTGWIFVVGWLTGILGLTAGWVAFVLSRPAIALVLPLPVAGIAAISVPQSAQVASGIAALALFAIGLGLLSSAQAFGPDDERPPLEFELRRILRAVPLVGLIMAALFFLSQANFLFPQPVIDPTKEPQKPKTVPLSAVEDRVLFEVDSVLTGPWRIGSLDVYDGRDWRLPAFSENRLRRVPSDGLVDRSLQAGVKATFTLRGLKGAVLPNLPNPVGIIAQGPALSYDERSGNIRTTEGDLKPGQTYTVTAAALPTVDALKRQSGPLPKELNNFLEIPPPPPAVQGLLNKAPKTSAWARFDFLRTYVLNNVTVTGAGVPVSVPPSRVQDMLAGSKEASPFEIVAAQAMLARWIGVPSRIGYGFDGGEKVNGVLAVRPGHGATFVEVYFPSYHWLPVIGTPRNAKASLGNAGEQQSDPAVRPSNDIGVQLYLPVVTPPASVLLNQVRRIVLIVVPAVLLLVLLYFSWPLAHKAFRRSRRRRLAARQGPRARVVLAYAEWRDCATDFGYPYHADTPLMFVERFVPDEEHAEFAWLVTRALWGDLDDEVDTDLADTSEELSRSLRRRLGRAQAGTLRTVAAISRASMRHPYGGADDLPATRKELANAEVAA